jgi:hypothetical protein
MVRPPCLVVIDVVNILDVPFFEAKSHPPVGANRNSPEAFHLAFERVQPETRQIHMLNLRRCLKGRQNVPELVNVFRIDAARIILLEEPSQSLVAYRLYPPMPSRDTCRMSV